MDQGITWVGLDAHKEFIQVAMRLPGERAFTEWRVVHTAKELQKLARKLGRVAPGPVQCAYEAGPCGFALQRTLEASGSGLSCMVVAPSLIPKKPGERVKTDRRDARKLCELLAAGLLTEVRTPTEAEEALRDLTRARAAAKKDQNTARHRLAKLLLRHGIRYQGRSAWTHRHREWLEARKFEERAAQVTFDSYLLALGQADERLKMLDMHLEQAAQEDAYRQPVGWLRSFRGIDTVTAITLVAELHGFPRFRHPRELMSYLGLTPSEHSSSGKANRGGITKAGNSHARRMLIEAGWHYRHRPSVGVKLRKRREGQPARVIAIADRAQHRLYRRYHQLIEGRGKHPNRAVVAVARELAGFIWAALQHEQAATESRVRPMPRATRLGHRT